MDIDGLCAIAVIEVLGYHAFTASSVVARHKGTILFVWPAVLWLIFDFEKNQATSLFNALAKNCFPDFKAGNAWATSVSEIVSPSDTKFCSALATALVLLSQSVAAFAERNHIFEKTHLFSMRRG
jgi:hypothetical protein